MVALPGPLVKTCPQCQKALQIITHFQAKNVACPACNRVLEVRSASLEVVKFQNKGKHEPLLPIGQKGKLKDIPYTVVGFLVNKEKNFKYYWREYMLFNAVHGYAFLSEYDGHWNYFTLISDFARSTSSINDPCHYMGREFRLFHKYGTEVVFAQGEFFWKIYEDKSRQIEYISPPYMLARSISAEEQTWMLGEYLEPEEIQQAFALEAEMPQQYDVGSIEPFSQDFSIKKVGKMAGIAAAIVCVLQVLFFSFHQNKVLLEEQYSLPSDSYIQPLPPVSSSVVEVTSTLGGGSSLEMELYAPVNNSWLSAGVSLMNTQTGKEYYIEIGVEYYSGTSEGENWSEGSPRTSEILSAIPAGKYQVLIQPFRESGTYGSNTPTWFSLTIRNDVPIWSNFLVCLLFLGAIPLVQGIRAYSFERSRWMSSDYSPYAQE
ncbi:DUF4178 domain-containing protein [Rufibacter sp. LB8]|nr:DUF4178 domain-containing protein [Rufibacter sp. LB8]